MFRKQPLSTKSYEKVKVKEVQEDLTNTKDIEKDVQSSLKKKIQYAKYTANEREKNNSLFKLMNIFKKIKCKLKSIQELSESLKI